nr:vWA domain-containing protein [Natronomonas gomsonensis]
MLTAVVLSTILVVSVLLSSVAFAGTAAAETRNADVVFVFDETGSMDAQAEDLANEVENVAEELDTQGIDARYGLVTYEDAESTEVNLALSSNPDDLKTGLDGIYTFGGTENASHGIHTALDMDYRDDAQKIIVVITDEDDDGTETARQQALQRIDDEDACLVAVSPDWYSGDIEGADELKTMSEAVACGEWTDVNTESFTTIVTDLIEVIEEETTQTTETTRSSPDFDVIEKSLSNTTVATDETFTADVVVENDGSAGGTYHARITDSDQVHYSERVEIESGETHTFSAPISYAEVDRYMLQINHRLLDYVTVNERQLTAENVVVTGGAIKRSAVMPNESYEVSATVENTGNYSGYATVPFAAGGDANNTTHVANETVYLSSGETKTVTHEATADVNASGANQTWAVGNTTLGSVSVLDENDSQVGIDAYTTPGAVTPNESYDVTGVVYNNGNSSRMLAVNFAPEHGRLGSLRMVSVAPGESMAVRHSTQASALSEPSSIGQTNTTERASTERTSETWWVNDERVNVTVVADG